MSGECDDVAEEESSVERKDQKFKFAHVLFEVY